MGLGTSEFTKVFMTWNALSWEFNSRAANLGPFSGKYLSCGNSKQFKGIWFQKDQMSQLRGFCLPLWSPYFILVLDWNWWNGNWACAPSCLLMGILRCCKETWGPEVHAVGGCCVEAHSYFKAAPLPLAELGNLFNQKHRAVWLCFLWLISLYCVSSCVWCSVVATLQKLLRNW